MHDKNCVSAEEISCFNLMNEWESILPNLCAHFFGLFLLQTARYFYVLGSKEQEVAEIFVVVPQSEDGEISLLSLECILYFPGYVQGMSDLLSPILFLMEDEVEAFWCFVGFMEKVVGANPCGPALQVTTVPVDITTA